MIGLLRLAVAKIPYMTLWELPTRCKQKMCLILIEKKILIMLKLQQLQLKLKSKKDMLLNQLG